MPTETGFGTTTTDTTPVSVIEGDVSSTRTLEITNGDCKVILSSSSGTSGDITFTYTLENDRAGNGSIKPEYDSTSSGMSSASEMTQGTGGDAKTPLTTSAAGTSHTFVWDTTTDLGKDFVGTVWVRITAYDRIGQIGDTMLSGVLKINVDNAPGAPTLVSPTDDFFDKNETPQFVWTIPDPIEGNSNMHFKLELDPTGEFDDNSGDIITFESRLDQTGWEYDSDGASSWVTIPHGGVPIITDPTLIGNQCRLTIQTEDRLDSKSFVWRCVAAVVT